MGSVAVVIPAGGVGARFGGRTPKQFLRFGAAPILVITVRHFATHPAVGAIVVAAPEGYVTRARRILAPVSRRTVLTVVHDAVRPLITAKLVDAVVAAAATSGAAICALPVAETVKRVRGDLVESTLDRSELWAVQTPQAFRADLLREAHEKARRDGIVGTDDAMLVERLGHPVRVVPGLPENVKITTPEDLRRARRGVRP